MEKIIHKRRKLRHWKHSKEWKDKMKVSMLGNKNGKNNKGRKILWGDKISKTLKERWKDIDYKYKNNQSERRSINAKEWRIAVFTRDGWTCQTCKEIGGKLEAHHINFQKDFKQTINGLINDKKKHLLKDDQANLVVLCDKCHDKLHNNEFNIKGLIKTSNGVKALIE